MKILQKIFIGVFSATIMLAGCNKNDVLDDSDDSGGKEETTVPEVAEVDPDSEDDLVEGSTFDATVRITYSGTSVTIQNSVDGVSIVQSGAGVTVTSTVKGVEYIVSGTTSNGFLKIYSDNKFKLLFEGVSITHASGPAVNIQSGKRCFLVLKDGTSSSLTDGSSYTSSSEDQKGCLFSEGEIIISGTGSLSVKGNYKHGICSDDYMRIREGNITVSGAASDGIHTNDAFIMDDGTLSVTSSGDGIECEQGYIYIKKGSVTVHSVDDGITASYEGTGTDSVNPTLYIYGGNVDVTTTGQKGHALKSTGDISITGGTHTIKTTGAAAKGIKADSNVVISGGATSVTTSGDTIEESGDTSSAHGVKADATFGMTGGELTVVVSGKGSKGISTDGSFVLDDCTMLSVTTTGSAYGTSSSGGGMGGGNNNRNSASSSPKGIKSDGYITINGGTCIVSSAHHEGIESNSRITINDGTVQATAYDDGLNVSSSSGSIVINGGHVYVYGANNSLAGSSGGSSAVKPGDGIDSNGSITVAGGIVVVAGGGSPDEGFDCDGTFSVNGGIIIGTGGQHSCLPSTSGKQYSIAYGGASVSSGEYIQFKNSSGESLITYKMPRAYSDMKMILSHPELTNGSYTLVKGGSYTGGTEVFEGYYTGGSYSGGTSTSVTVNSTLTKVGNVSNTGGGNMPGRP